MRLVAENLSGERAGEPVFAGVNFALRSGEMLTVTGPNGAGKSTLLRMIAGLLPFAGGSLILESDLRGDVAAITHYLGPLNAMKPALSVCENLRFWQAFLGEHRFPVQDALEAVGLGEIGHLPVAFLSTGQRRRASIAKLLVSRRPIWLLDEPTSGLDKASQVRIAGLIQSHLAEGGIVIAATHLPLGVEGTLELSMGQTELA